MRRKVLICSLMVAAIVLVAGCRRIDPAPATGDLLLSISAGEMGTKRSDQEDGKKFQKLLVIITDDQNKFLQGKYLPMDDSPADKQENIEFTGLPAGKTYKVFAFANIDHATWSPGFDFAQIENQNFSSILDENDKLKINQLLTLTSGDVPGYPSGTGMLLTGWQEVFVGVNKNLGTVTLRRPVLRLNVLVRNHTGKKLLLTDLHFSAFNPKSAYLLDRWTAEGVPGVPPGDPTYTALHPIHASDPLEIPASATDAQELVYTTLLFENAATDRYKMFATLKLELDVNIYTSDYSLRETEDGCVLKLLDKETRQASEITYMSRNQDLTVVLNVYYEEVLDKFTFNVESWTTGVGGSHAFD